MEESCNANNMLRTICKKNEAMIPIIVMPTHLASTLCETTSVEILNKLFQLTTGMIAYTMIVKTIVIAPREANAEDVSRLPSS